MKKLFLFIILICACCNIHAQISEKAKNKLCDAVVQNYISNNISGCSVYKISGKNVIVSTVTVSNKKPKEIIQRVAQVKATRSIVEFINGVKNNSVTEYNVSDLDSYAYDENQSGNNNLVISNINSTTSSDISEGTQKNNSYSFNDKIIQSSVGYVKNVQCLKCVLLNDENVYFYFTLL